MQHLFVRWRGRELARDAGGNSTTSNHYQSNQTYKKEWSHPTKKRLSLHRNTSLSFYYTFFFPKTPISFPQVNTRTMQAPHLFTSKSFLLEVSMILFPCSQGTQHRLLRLRKPGRSADIQPLIGPVMAERRQVRSASGVPQLDHAIFATTGKHPSIGADLDRAHPRGMGLDGSQQRAMRDFPPEQFSICAPSYEDVPIGVPGQTPDDTLVFLREAGIGSPGRLPDEELSLLATTCATGKLHPTAEPCHGTHSACMSLQAVQQRASACLPGQDNTICAPARQLGPIRLPCNAVHSCRVPRTDPPALAGAQVPHAYDLIIAAAGKQLSIWTPSDAHHQVGMPLQDMQAAPRSGIPDPHRLINTPAGKQLSIRTPGDCAHETCVAAEDPYRRAIGQAPLSHGRIIPTAEQCASVWTPCH